MAHGSKASRNKINDVGDKCRVNNDDLYVLIELILGEDITHQELHSCAGFSDSACLASYIALRVNNSIAVVGANRVRILHNTCIRAAYLSDAIELAVSERHLDIGSTRDLVLRVCGRHLSIDVEQHDAFSFVVGRNQAASISSLTKPFVPGRHYAINIGHNITAFGLIDVTDAGCSLTNTRRVQTSQLRNLNDTMRFIGDCTCGFGVPSILSGNSDHKLSISIAEPVIRGHVAFNRNARVSRILLELQNGVLPRLGEARAQKTGRVGKHFVINDSCATGIYASRATAGYGGGLASGISVRTLAIRFGTYSAISYIGDDGYNHDRFNEYSYLRVGDGSQNTLSKMSVIGSALSYRVFQDGKRTPPADDDGDAPRVGHENYVAKPSRDDVKNMRVTTSDIYMATGRTIARLVAEIRRFDAIENVVVLGSVGNGIDDAAWAGMRTGIAEVVGMDGSDLPPLGLTFLPGASHRSSLLGAAMEHSERLALHQ